jgi:hypothetical protein
MKKHIKIFHTMIILTIMASACRWNQPAKPPISPTTNPIPFDLTSSPKASATPETIPTTYQPLYNTLKKNLDLANTTLDALPKETQSDLVFAADLLTANANRATDLLLPSTLASTQLYLDRLYSLGIRGVKISVLYPILTTAFPDSAKYVGFYRQVAQEVRSRNMTLVVQQTVVFANTPFSDANVSYAGLTFDRFKSENLQMAQTIIDAMSPDYLVLVAEPDTAAHLTGLKALNDPKKSLEYVKYILNGLNKRSTKVGAGSGTWSPPEFVQLFTAEPGIDFISLHIYPITPTIIQQSLDMAEIANSAGKPTIISEAWLYKTDELTVSENVAASDTIFRRDCYSFFLPLDEEFIQTMVKFADTTHSSFISFFWGSFFYGYLNYDPSWESLTYNQLRQKANAVSSANLRDNAPGPLGIFLQKLISSR